MELLPTSQATEELLLALPPQQAPTKVVQPTRPALALGELPEHQESPEQAPLEPTEADQTLDQQLALLAVLLPPPHTGPAQDQLELQL